MQNAAAARARFLADAVATASPAKLLTMLYDRLVLDLSRAERAQVAGDRSTANVQLQHAQDVVTELHSSLDTSGASGWAGAAGLAGLYTFLASELVEANISGDAARTASCRVLVEPLRDAWHEAAQLSAQQAAPALGQAAAPAVPAQRTGAPTLLSVSA
ncbi:flagellar export chaperone FliS [uncultured Pseudokineococcus sp.]|uniref:flagellar export chaperone FliS n=1 Tax=uncultured Pseudokineococcus sp. TaxID=1642928 RepID=UPI00261BF0C5|nr:flagellar export chaperone FliS [uncultured Pseudokineococcus sp.]